MTCRRRWRCFSAISRHSSPSSTCTLYAPDTMSPRPRPMSPQSIPMRTLIQRARRGIEVLHQRSARAPAMGASGRPPERGPGRVGAVPRRARASERPCRDRDDALGGGRLHPEQRARDHLDALRRLVARRLELEHALHLAEARLLAARATELVAELDRSPAQREVQHERRHASRRPPRSRGRGTGAGSSRLAALLARARSLALRERGLCFASRVREATTGFLVSRLPDVAARGTRASPGGPRASETR